MFLAWPTHFFTISSSRKTVLRGQSICNLGRDLLTALSPFRHLILTYRNGDPYGTADLTSTLASQQPYDVILLLHLPRTPSNIAAGNFMLDLSLLAPQTPAPSNIVTSTIYGNTSVSVITRSQRAAILTYASPIVDTAKTFTGLPWHVLGWKKESELLEINMFEGVEFAKGWANLPQSVKVVVKADEKMQFYEVGIRMIARFGGLRWILYNHRIFSFLFFTTSFWASSMLSMVFAWFIVSSYLAAPITTKAESVGNVDHIKRERSDSDELDPTSFDDLSDTSRTFPTLGRQMPLHFTGRGNFKQEGGQNKRESDEPVQSTNTQPLTNEADDEGYDVTEETIGWRDSGIGTGLDEERLGSVQRRRKALGGNDGVGRR